MIEIFTGVVLGWIACCWWQNLRIYKLAKVRWWFRFGRFGRWLAARPIRRRFAKLYLRFLWREYDRLVEAWKSAQSTENTGDLFMVRAEIHYYERAFNPNGKYNPNCAYDYHQWESLRKELKKIGFKCEPWPCK